MDEEQKDVSSETGADVEQNVPEKGAVESPYVPEVPVEEAVNLDKLRDDRCVPIAKQILNNLSSDLIPTDMTVTFDINPLIKKSLQLFLDADLNIASETTYVPQILLSVFSGLNKAVQSCVFLPMDDARYANIAKKILEITAMGEIHMGMEATPEVIDADFIPVKEQLSALFTEEKLSWLEIKYIMDTLFNSFNTFNRLVSDNIVRSSELAEAKLFEVQEMSDVTMKKIDDVLKK